MFAKISNNQVEKFPIMNLCDEFPNVSFPLEILDTHMPEGYVKVFSSDPPSIGENQNAIPDTPIQIDGQWYLGWKIINLT